MRSKTVWNTIIMRIAIPRAASISGNRDTAPIVQNAPQFLICLLIGEKNAIMNDGISDIVQDCAGFFYFQYLCAHFFSENITGHISIKTFHGQYFFEKPQIPSDKPEPYLHFPGSKPPQSDPFTGPDCPFSRKRVL